MRNNVGALLVLFAVLVVFISGIINMRLISVEYSGSGAYLKSIRNVRIEDNKKGVFSEGIIDGVSYIAGINNDLVWQLACDNMYPSDNMPVLYKNVISPDSLDNCIDIYTAIMSDIRYFPVPRDVKNGVDISYDNSWEEERNYGGKRMHEGTDIMSGNNVRGYFPVVSMTDGVIEKVGWLNLGGYRVGVRSPSGAYFYYAHLCEFADGIEEGATVKAGMVLGTMGDTGYSKEEGTTGKFPVHLHLGIYMDIDGKEISFNPYYILKLVEKYRREFI